MIRNLIKPIGTVIRIGWQSATANMLPMFGLWTLAAALVFGYYALPCVHDVLEPIRRWQESAGWIAAVVNRAVFCAFLPGCFILPIRALRPEHPCGVLLGQTLWGCICGLVVNQMYSIHAVWLGTRIDLWTLSAKTALCQFVWAPVFFIPIGSVVYFWLGHGLSLAKTRTAWPHDFILCTIIPNLVCNWFIWIPATFLIHIFPTALQIQLSGLLGVFQGLLMLTVGRGTLNARSDIR